ncbi:MAG TPA: hypothetical protein VNE62_06670 [Actinomycetota bacterium]|nr:hypothetical protein [Actinomycetota bacterium]
MGGAPPGFDVAVDCFGGTHTVRVRAGEPTPTRHGEADAVIESLGGSSPTCEYATWAVQQCPRQLLAYEHFDLVGRTPTQPLYARAMTEAWAEPQVDPARVHPVLRRLGSLHGILRSSRDPDSELVVGRAKSVCRSTLGPRAIKRFRFAVGEVASVDRLSGVHLLTFSRRWLTTVFLFRLECLAGELVLGVDFADDTAALTYLTRDGKGWTHEVATLTLDEVLANGVVLVGRLGSEPDHFGG